MSTIEIRSRYTGAVLWRGEAISLRAAVEAAVAVGADLTDTDLLAGANLTDADLARANLTDADLARANLTDADLTDAYRSESSAKPETERRAEWEARRAQSRKARAEAFRSRNPNVPVVEKLDLRILKAIESGAVSLEMGTWHSCETTHRRAGLSIHLAGDAGYALEKELGPERAGRAIYLASTGRAPDFFASNEAAMADIRRCAETEV